MPFNFSFRISFRFVHPFDTDCLVTFRKSNKFLNVIFHDNFDFFIHCFSPLFVLYSFIEFHRFKINKETKKSEIIKPLNYLIEILKTPCTFFNSFIKNDGGESSLVVDAGEIHGAAGSCCSFTHFICV